MRNIAAHIRDIIAENFNYWDTQIHDVYNLRCVLDEGVKEPTIFRQLYNILSLLSPNLVKACGVKTLLIRSDMGPNKPYYPNHGYFICDRVALNVDIFLNPDQPDDFMDHHGYFLTRAAQTLIHELGHGFDAYHGNLSLKPEWLSLSGWKQNYEPGLKRLVINDKNAPKIVGEWFYKPDAEFTRFYAKRNPWDDFADAFAYYASGIKNKVPTNKITYFDTLLKKYL